MGNMLSAVWRCRYFWLSLVKMDLRARYRRSILGMGWSLLNPIAMTVILCTVFSQLMNMPLHIYGPFLMAGIACWNYIHGVAIQGCHCFFQGESYIRQHPAPLAIYPLRAALGGTIHFLIALGLVIVLAWFCHTPMPASASAGDIIAALREGFAGTPALLSLIPALLVFFCFAWAVALLAGFANVCFQDTQHLLEVGLQILFYATPIIYPEKLLRDKNLGWLVDYNPLVPLLQLVRQPILEGTVPSLTMYAAAMAMVLVMILAAGATLARLQRRLIFYL